MEEWLNKIKQTFDKVEPNNPTADSVVFMLNRMTEEYREYKELGSIRRTQRKLKKMWNQQSMIKLYNITLESE